MAMFGFKDLNKAYIYFYQGLYYTGLISRKGHILPPEEVYLVDDDGFYLVDDDGFYLTITL